MTAQASDLGRVAARGSGVTLAAQAIRIALHFLTIVALSRLLSPADFGLVALVTAIVGVSEVLRDLGLSMAAVQAPTLTRGQKSNLFWINALSGLLFALVAFLLAGPIASLFGEAELYEITVWISLVFLINGLSAQFRAEINRKMRFLRLSAVDVVSQAVALCVAVWLAASGFGYWALVAQLLLYSAGGLLLSMLFAGWFPGLPTRREQMWPLVRFGIGLTGTQAIAYAVRSVDTIALGIAWNPTVTGLYNRAYQLVAAPFAQIAAPLTRVAVPVLARAWSRRPETFEDYLSRAQLVGCYVLGPAYLAIAGLGESVIGVALGPGWSAAVPILQVLCIGGLFRTLTQISYWAYLARGETGKQLRIYAWFQPLVVVSVLAGLPWGALGVAVGSSVGLVFYWVISLVAVGRNLSINGVALLRQGIRSVALAAAPVGALCLASSLLLSGLLLPIVVGLGLSTAYFAVLYLISPRYRADLRILLTFIKKGIQR